MAMLESAVLDNDVLASEFPAWELASRLYSDVVVSDIDETFRDQNATGDTWVDRVGVRRASRRKDCDVRYDDILAFLGDQVEGRGVLQCDIAHDEICDAIEQDHPRTGQRVPRPFAASFLRGTPPFFA